MAFLSIIARVQLKMYRAINVSEMMWRRNIASLFYQNNLGQYGLQEALNVLEKKRSQQFEMEKHCTCINQMTKCNSNLFHGIKNEL